MNKAIIDGIDKKKETVPISALYIGILSLGFFERGMP